MSDIDAGVISTRLSVIHDLLGFLAAEGEISGARLREDMLVRLAVERAICQLVDQAADINAHIATRLLGRPPQTQRESFDLAVRAGYLDAESAGRLVHSVGLRNLLVHEYTAVDLEQVALAIPHAIHDYRGYVRSIAAALTSP